MSLVDYRKKRHFGRTAEPRGKSQAKKTTARALAYVIQKHDASHLHYDFRLELEGTLKSWAVPKGPSLDPAQKRLAIQVEDHPLEYGSFEGTIPAGEYGGGTVMVWDSGTWTPEVDPEEGYRTGRLKFSLNGEKLSGSWALVKTSRPARSPQWLLIKHRDAAAKASEEEDILESAPDSAATGRTMEEIAAGDPPRRRGRLGRGRSQSGKSAAPSRSNGQSRTTSGESRTKNAGPGSSKPRPTAAPARAVRGVKRQATTRDVKAAIGAARGGKVSARAARGVKASGRTAQALRKSPRTRRSTTLDLAGLEGVRPGPMPKQPQAELATLVAEPPSGPDWFHEIKFDGYRMFCCIDNGKVRFVSRNGQDWTGRLQALAKLAAGVPAQRAVLDGEVVVLDAKGISQFQLLQNAMGNQKPTAQNAPLFYAFDLVYLDGFDLTGATLETRKSVLQALLQRSGVPPEIRLSEHVEGAGEEFKEQACSAQLEGIVSKRRNSLYVPGRGADWLKSKCRQTEEFVIGGYTPPEGARVGFGALLLGYFRPDGKLAYAGRVGTGFDTRLLRDLTKRLKSLEQPQRPFAEPPAAARAALRARGIRWVRPELVAQIEFSNWTDAGILRQASYQGLREDKPAREVTLELPMNQGQGTRDQ